MSKPKPAPSLLVVDDDQGLLRLAAKTLGREGFSVATAGSAGEAIAELQQSQPDLMLLDLKLQDAEAKDLIGPMAELGRLPPFLIITGQGDEAVAVEMMKSGALDYLVKGKDFLEFLPAVVRRALKEVEKEKKLAAAEQALLLSEERFRVALKNSPIMVFNQDVHLRYTWIYNVPPGQNEAFFSGKTDEEIFPPEEADRLTQLKARVLATGTAVRQEVSCTLDGIKHNYDLTVEPVRDASGKIGSITGAALEITERKRMEQEVLQISDIEQRRMGQDLHDGVCQYLAGIEMKSQLLEQKLKKKSPLHAAQAGQISNHVRDVLAQTRSLARSLSPFILESEGLFSGLKELASGAEKLFNVSCLVTIEPSVSVPDQKAATHLYRIAQEAVTNAVKHGKAKEIEISLSNESGQTVLKISDNGQGFAPQAGASGMGLRIMQYRANIIGATLLIQKKPAGGVNVVCFLKSANK